MITVVAGGDSFIFGAELQDQINGGPSMSTYPALLVRDAGLEYICAAKSGNSNMGIARQTMNVCQAHNNKNLFVFVTWTFSCRYEFFFNQPPNQYGENWYSLTPWDTHETLDEILDIVEGNANISKHHTDHFDRLRETGLGNFSKIFYKNVGDNEVYETYTTLKEIVFLQNYLKAYNINYMFHCVDTNIFYNNDLTQQDINVKTLRAQIDMSKWFLFDPAIEGWDTTHPRGFYQWAIEGKYPVGTTHPLESAHADAAKLMKEKFNELVKKSVQ